MQVRVGQGFDVHPVASDPERRLVLGGVTFDGVAGLVGHSDADVIAHAVADALLGAAGLGDIGQHFPDTDPAFAEADSIEVLRRAADAVRAAGWTPGNVDCTVVLDTPKVARGGPSCNGGCRRGRGAGDRQGQAARGDGGARARRRCRLLRRRGRHRRLS